MTRTHASATVGARWTDSRYDVASVGPSGDDADRPDEGSSRSRRVDYRRAALGTGVIAAVVAAAATAVYRNRTAFTETVRDMGAASVAASVAFGVLAVGATFPMWDRILRGLGVRLPVPIGARVFFVSQLGKYVPGSVWPVLMQMEAGRARGANRRTMLATNLFSLVLNCTVGLTVACLLLPLFDTDALHRFWWLLLAIPPLVGLLHPRAMPWLLDRAFGVVGRPPLDERIDVRHTAQAAAWSLASWAALGAHVTVLCAALGYGGWSTFVLATGGAALAVCAGVLFIPAPAGAGIRDVILALVLSSILTSTQALAVVVASRVILIGCDLLLAAASLAWGAGRRGRHRLGTATAGE